MFYEFFSTTGVELVEMSEREARLVAKQVDLLPYAYTSRDVGLTLAPALLAHILKLIINIILFAVTLLACLFTLLPYCNPILNEEEPDGDETLRAAMTVLLSAEVKLIGCNMANIALSIVSPIVRGLHSIPSYHQNTARYANDLSITDKAVVKQTWSDFTPVDSEIAMSFAMK